MGRATVVDPRPWTKSDGSSGPLVVDGGFSSPLRPGGEAAGCAMAGPEMRATGRGRARGRESVRCADLEAALARVAGSSRGRRAGSGSTAWRFSGSVRAGGGKELAAVACSRACPRATTGTGGRAEATSWRWFTATNELLPSLLATEAPASAAASARAAPAAGTWKRRALP
jgi:hypothetical protein